MKTPRSTSFIILTTTLTVIIAIWQQWNVEQITSLYWVEGLLIGIFSSLLIFFYEARYLGVLLMATQLFLYSMLGILLFDDLSDLTQYFQESVWLFTFVLILIAELIIVVKIIAKHRVPFKLNALKNTDQLLIRSIVRLITIGIFVQISLFLNLRNLWAVSIFILLTGIVEWKIMHEFNLPIQKK